MKKEVKEKIRVAFFFFSGVTAVKEQCHIGGYMEENGWSPRSLLFLGAGTLLNDL